MYEYPRDKFVMKTPHEWPKALSNLSKARNQEDLPTNITHLLHRVINHLNFVYHDLLRRYDFGR